MNSISTCLRATACATFAAALVFPAGAEAAKHLGQRTLKEGHRGQDVRVLQDYLGRAGYETPVTGYFGSMTTASVRSFESAADRRVDGVVTRPDARALRVAAAGGKPETAAVPTTTGGGGAAYGQAPEPTNSGRAGRATLTKSGTALAPPDAPQAVKDIIAAGNRIAKKPYVYGGGHGKWEDRGYDCSGSVSYALYGAKLLDAPMASGGFMNWAKPGRGKWVTTYAHGSHMYMVVAGLRFDTSAHKATGTRWSAEMRSPAGYSVRHPAGL